MAIFKEAKAFFGQVPQWEVVSRTRILGFTNGCFDLLHAGHVDYLSQARKECDFLIVGLNTDVSVRGLKGSSRPVQNESSRAKILDALRCVDAVIFFGEDTPVNLIKALQPDRLFKGSDYQSHEVIGKDIVEARGGRVVLLPFSEGQSTTAIVERIQNQKGV
ncbi:MAG: D-glycero-beta-D-manno-heptose 1-phosphate adenylyltransferase [Holophagaceae bacterium]|jgi:D-beta-D-heptose 7-phosphate kinase/D-beta-D-heptose 1-phosphate adenosyltransferase